MSGDDEERLDDLTSPLFQMVLEFERAFCAKAIDELDVTDEDAEAMARIMDLATAAHPDPEHPQSPNPFAYFLRRVKYERILRRMGHQVSAIWSITGERSIAVADVQTEFDKLPNKGEA